MKIAMFTNTYLPHVGGVARSVSTLETECRRQGHEVKVVAPEVAGAEASPHVLRLPSIQNFNGSDFAVRLPAPALIRDFMDGFRPDVIHSHHPFLLGDTALRQAWRLGIPLVFTHHTLYERYTHYVPLDSPLLQRLAVELATEYCNLCHEVIAPSESIRDLLLDRGVTVPITPIPTGIDTAHFSSGDGTLGRRRLGIPEKALLIGHVGRLAEEKNLLYLAEAVAHFLNEYADSEAAFLIVGEGDAGEGMLDIFGRRGVRDRIYRAGKLTGTDLADAYAAMDVFVFSSQSETQGMVIAEAMAAGKPVLALDGPGVRETVTDGVNGRLLASETRAAAFAEALSQMTRDPDHRRRLAMKAEATATALDQVPCAGKVLEVYERLTREKRPARDVDHTTTSTWDALLSSLGTEWDLLSAKVSAAVAAVVERERATEDRPMEAETS